MKILFLACLYISVELTRALTILPFCSSKSVHDTFSSWKSGTNFTPNELYLDGSDAAISSFLPRLSSGTTSCTCAIKNAGASIRTLDVRHYADVLYKDCGKSFEIVKFGDNAVHRFGCAEGDLLELESFEEDGKLTITLYVDTPRPEDTKYKLRIEPDIAADLMVTCWSPIMVETSTSSTSSSTSTSTSSSTASSSSTSSIPDVISTTKSQDSDHKAVLIGVVSAVMVTVIVILTCFLCFICIRRRSKKKKDKKTTTEDPERNVDHETQPKRPLHASLYNTMSHVYASIRSNITVAGIRKKASLPKNALDRLRGRAKRDFGTSEPTGYTASGLYDSIKSNSGNGNRSGNTDDVVHAPQVDKLALTRHDSCESEQYIHAASDGESRPPMTAQYSTDSDKYITPVADYKEQRKVSVVHEETEDTLNTVKGFDNDGYLEPVKTSRNKHEHDSIQEDPYTVMNKTEGLRSDKDCYMTGRPRYLDTLKKDNAKVTVNDTVKIKETNITETKEHRAKQDGVYVNHRGLKASSPTYKEDNDTETASGAIPKIPVSIQPSGEYISMDSNSPVSASAEEDTSYFSMKRSGDFALCGENTKGYDVMDNAVGSANSGSLANSSARDSGYVDHVTSISQSNGPSSDKIRVDSEEKTISPKGVSGTSEDIFDLATITLGTPTRDSAEIERKMENAKPKLKRYVKKTETDA